MVCPLCLSFHLVKLAWNYWMNHTLVLPVLHFYLWQGNPGFENTNNYAVHVSLVFRQLPRFYFICWAEVGRWEAERLNHAVHAREKGQSLLLQLCIVCHISNLFCQTFYACCCLDLYHLLSAVQLLQASYSRNLLNLDIMCLRFFLNCISLHTTWNSVVIPML